MCVTFVVQQLFFSKIFFSKKKREKKRKKKLLTTTFCTAKKMGKLESGIFEIVNVADPSFKKQVEMVTGLYNQQCWSFVLDGKKWVTNHTLYGISNHSTGEDYYLFRNAEDDIERRFRCTPVDTTVKTIVRRRRKTSSRNEDCESDYDDKVRYKRRRLLTRSAAAAKKMKSAVVGAPVYLPSKRIVLDDDDDNGGEKKDYDESVIIHKLRKTPNEVKLVLNHINQLIVSSSSSSSQTDSSNPTIEKEELEKLFLPPPQPTLINNLSSESLKCLKQHPRLLRMRIQHPLLNYLAHRRGLIDSETTNSSIQVFLNAIAKTAAEYNVRFDVVEKIVRQRHKDYFEMVAMK